jgi:hypothetical protein
MASDRIFPSQATNPGGMTGTAYAAAVKEEGDALWNRVVNHLGSVVGTNSITAGASPALAAAYAHGQVFRFIAVGNNTTAVTINIDSRGVKDLKKRNGDPLAADDLVSGQSYEFFYDSTADDFYLTAELIGDVAVAAVASLNLTESWTLIDDTLVSGLTTHSVAITPGLYSQIQMVGIGVGQSSGTLRAINVALRNATTVVGSIWTSTATISGTQIIQFDITFQYEVITAGRRMMRHGKSLINTTAEDIAVAGSAMASVPDNIACYFTTNPSFDEGRILTYGRLLPV